jgi:hypothetical protein
VAEFSPKELDQLEDALEGLEDVEDLAALGLEDPLRERLGDYQNLLRMSREALPMEDVPAGLLDGVLAEARDAETAEPERPSLWKRWRAAVIPVVALAGTTAAVLWIVKPSEPMMDASEVPAETAAKETTPGAAAPSSATESDDAIAPAPEMAEADEEAPATAEPAEEEPVGDAKQASKPSAAARKSEGKMDAAPPAPEPAPVQKAVDKDQVWDTIEDGDAARRRGDCDSAERLYRQAEAAAPNAKARAKAWMGLGLCAEQRDGDGSKYLNDAQAADPSLRAVIERERSASRSAARKGKPKPKKKSKQPAFDDAMEQNAFPGK